MPTYQNGGCVIFIWNGVFQLRPDGKIRTKQQDNR